MTFRQFAFRNVLRNRRVYAAFFLASVFSVMVFFLYSMLLFHPTIENRFVEEIAILGMGVAEVILYIFTLFFLFYSMRAFLQARSKEFGILLHLGMKKSQLNRLIFIETMMIGVAAIGVGTGLGFIFSKFFFMVVREVVYLPTLPLYLSWKPFFLTIGAFLSLFIIISFIAPVFIRSGKVIDFIRRDGDEKESYAYSKLRGYLGILFLTISYVMAALTSNATIIGLIFFLPPLATIGTYYFFTDSVPLILSLLRKQRFLFWRRSRLFTLAEGVVWLKENARMFFIVTIVSTIAFMSVGTLASLTSFASQYREMHPLGLVYISEADNPFEKQHVQELLLDLEKEELTAELTVFTILRQKSSFSGGNVDILRQSDVNLLADSLGYEPVHLKRGEAIFLPPSTSSYKNLKSRVVDTVFEESKVAVRIEGAYPHQLFSANSVGTNAIVLNDIDFAFAFHRNEKNPRSFYRYYAFHIPKWQETKEVGLAIEALVTEGFIEGNTSELLFAFDNPGLNYSIIRTTFSLLLLTGMLLAVVFFLAAGSFIYFRLYTRLDQDRKQFDMLRRLGLTNREFKQIVNQQLVPQFFFPWGVAMLHSSFAFLSLQVIWDALAEISIVKELLFVLGGFTVMQLCYFYLIRWRYLVHIRTPK